MRLDAAGSPHLTYCTNIHAGETWPEVRRNLERYVLAVKARVAPDRPFGVGLRLSAAAAAALADPGAVEDLQAFLATHALYVFTINGFPYGPFHGVPVKERVYLPDWLDDARLAYSDLLARLLVRLLPAEADLEGSVSTVPGAFQLRVRRTTAAAAMAERMLRHVATLHRLREETGRVVSLALEPEAGCVLETVADVVGFFERHLFAPAAARRLSALVGSSRADAAEAIQRHLGICFDACHMAVEYEDPAAAFASLAAKGIRVPKIQLSAGLVARLGNDDAETQAALARFAEGVYLHQVVERRPGGTRRFLDLPAALAVAGDDHEPREWRIHFHVPLFRERLGCFTNTQAYLREVLRLVRDMAPAPHLEVETYTWDVLPEEYRDEDVATAVARELTWIVEQMAA